MTQRQYLNLGCGNIRLPGERPAHHLMVDAAIYDYPLWHNVDRNSAPGVDECVDLFTYPWPWTDNSYDGALLSHLCEHIPHEIRRYRSMLSDEGAVTHEDVATDMRRKAKIESFQDGWFAFFSELHRVLTPGAIVHILSPYAWSQGAITDPTHTRMLTEASFLHSMAPDPDAPFNYATGGLHFKPVTPAVYHLSETFSDLQDDAAAFQRALLTRINVAYEFYIKLEAIKT